MTGSVPPQTPEPAKDKQIGGLLGGFLSIADGLSKAFAIIGGMLLVLLIAVTVTEVAARYVFNSPSIWAFDISYFLNGALFMLGAAYTLLMKGHVKIDVLSTMLPARVQAGLWVAFSAFIFLPVLGLLLHATVLEVIDAYATADKVLSSAWAPLRWPFLAPLSAGLFALWFQCLAEALRQAVVLFRPSDSVFSP